MCELLLVVQSVRTSKLLQRVPQAAAGGVLHELPSNLVPRAILSLLGNDQGVPGLEVTHGQVTTSSESTFVSGRSYPGSPGSKSGALAGLAGVPNVV